MLQPEIAKSNFNAMTTNNKTHEKLTDAEKEVKHSGKGNFGNPEQHSKAGKAGSEARKDETGHYKISEETHKKLSEAGKKGGAHSHGHKEEGEEKKD